MDADLIKQVTELVVKALNENNNRDTAANIPIGVSARHVHLTQEHVNILFGAGHQLTKKKILMGGQYACEETVTIASSKMKCIENVRVLGPVRKSTQVEVSKTDAVKLGANAPLRDSGDISGSEPMSIIGPHGVVHIAEGCITAKRHIHFSPAEAARFNVTDGQAVQVKIDGVRGGVFSNVLVRVDETFTLEMHIDTDEANAFGIGSNFYGVIV
jgi:putative phosphotransacetylase